MARVRLKGVLLAGVVTLLLAAAGSAVAGPRVWVPVSGTMSAAREYPNVVVLQNGHALVLGGQDGVGLPAAAVDVYDPTTRSWLAPAASMNIGRMFSATAVLADGRVLVAGGISTNGTEASAELYDPAQNTWTLQTPMPYAMNEARAVTLNDGRVLVAGGSDGNGHGLASTLLYTPGDNGGTWAPGPSMTAARFLPDLTLLSDGRVLVSGGYDDNSQGVSSAERLDAGATAWQPAGAMSAGRALALTVRLADGRVLSVGGTDSIVTTNTLASADIYDPDTNSWSSTAPMSTRRLFAAGGLLPGGRVIVAGGGANDANNDLELSQSAELFDPTTGTWSVAAPLPGPLAIAGSAVVDGGLLVAGGTPDGSTALASGVLYASNNHPPTAVATAPATATGVAGSNAAVAVSAAGSSDPDGDPLIYTWSEGASVLVVSAAQNATVGLPVGAHTLTLTVDDGFGGTATATASVTVTDATAGLQAQIAQLTAQLAQTQQQLAAAQQVAANAVALVQSSLRARFHDHDFTVPGATPEAQLQAIVQAVLSLKTACLADVYDALTPPRHHGGGHHDRGHGGNGPRDGHGPHDGHDGPGGPHGGGHPHP
jgi:N-acetylneuraminic acid mutarotase